MDALNYLFPIGAIFALSSFCAITGYKEGQIKFSSNVFLSSMSIGIAVLVWIPLIPSYMIIFTVLIIGGMFFMNKGGESPDE